MHCRECVWCIGIPSEEGGRNHHHHPPVSSPTMKASSSECATCVAAALSSVCSRRSNCASSVRWWYTTRSSSPSCRVSSGRSISEEGGRVRARMRVIGVVSIRALGLFEGLGFELSEGKYMTVRIWDMIF